MNIREMARQTMRESLLEIGWIIPQSEGQCGWHKGCDKPVKAFDLCMTHYTYCRRQGLLGLSPEEARRKTKDNNLRAHHQLSLKEYEYILYTEQQGICALDPTHQAPPIEELIIGRLWPVDHNHLLECHPVPGRSCEQCRRGIVCPGCNTVLTTHTQDPIWFERAARYLGF